MSKTEIVVVASRALALLFTVWALADASQLPESVTRFFAMPMLHRRPRSIGAATTISSRSPSW